MNIYFHQYIIKFLVRYLPDLFDRYFNDYYIAEFYRLEKEEKIENYKPNSKCCATFINKEN